MKKSGFLSKVEIVEGSEEMKNSYLKKSESNLQSAKILLEEDKLEESVGLVYYSMYNFKALFFKVGIKCENHTSSINLLKNLFELDNSKIEFAKKERIDKQYYVDFKISKKDVEEMFVMAEDFNSIIYNFIEKLSNEDVKIFRNKLIGMLK